MASKAFHVAVLDGLLGFRAVFEDAPSSTVEPLVIPASHQPHGSNVFRCDTAGELAVRKRRVIAIVSLQHAFNPNGLVRASSANYDFAEDSC